MRGKPNLWAGWEPVRRSRSKASRWSLVSRTTTFFTMGIVGLLTGLSGE